MKKQSLKKLIVQLEREMISHNYTKSTLKNYQRFWKQLISYFSNKKKSNFSNEIAMQYLNDSYNFNEKAKTGLLSQHEIYLRRMVWMLGEYESNGTILCKHQQSLRCIHKSAFTEALDKYMVYCKQHGYSQSTIRNQRLYTFNFFAFLESKEKHNSQEITMQIIQDYVNTLIVYSYNTVGHILYSLRCLLRFLFKNGFHNQNLSETIPRQRARKDCSIPSVWTPEDVLKLVNAVDRGNPCGKRDYAIILLVTRLGIRAGDVRKLKMENIKWENNRIEFIQSKTSQSISLPLLKDVGWAIIDYLKEGRPKKTDSPYVFLRHVAPYEGLGDGNCFYHIISRCMRIAKIKTPLRQKTGMHSLRHSLASTLLEKNTPLSTIAEILGHASVESTAVYLKTNVKALRQCALNEPGGIK